MALLALPQPYDFHASTERFRSYGQFAGDPPVYIDEQGLWDNGLTAFAGFRFSNASGVHYGWVRLFVEETSNNITIFDSTGLAIQDLAVAIAAYERRDALDLQAFDL